MQRSVELLLLAAAVLLAGAWLVGGRVAVGVAVMALALGLGAVALLREVPEQARRRGPPTVAEVFERARNAP